MDIMKLMKQASKLKKVQKEIARTVVEAEADGSKLAITGEGDVKTCSISQEVFEKGKAETEKNVAVLMSICLRKQQEMQKEKAKEAMGGMNIPGL